MSLNFNKCKCFHVGHGNLNLTYKIGNVIIDTTMNEEVVGVTVSANLKVSQQCEIKDNVVHKEEIIIPLYKSTIRPYLEYCRHHTIKRYSYIRQNSENGH